jgi:outer membrane protein assembly factor BamD
MMACSSNDKDDASNKTAEELYSEAVKEYDKKNYDDAAKKFSTLEKEFPFSKFTKDGLLKTAYSQYETEEYESASATLQRYLDLYPGSDKSDYALYLLSMCYYNQISDPRRDQEVSLTAQKYLNELINRYPESDYSVDGKIKLDFVNNQIAAKEMIVGRFYLKNDQLHAAINRFKEVVKNHQTTVHVKEALYRLTESYLTLGLVKPAYRAASLLGHNYPDSEWYHRAYALMKEHDPQFIPNKPASDEEEKSWFDSIL